MLHAPLLMKSGYCLASHLRLCRVNDQTVGLDLRLNRYFALDDRTTRALQRCGVLERDPWVADAMPSHGDVDIPSAALERAGLLTKSSDIEARITLARPRTSVGFEYAEHSDIELRHLPALLYAWLWARWVLRTRSFADIAQGMARRRGDVSIDVDRRRLIVLVCVFRRLRPFLYRASGHCLLHALTLQRFLSLHGLHPHWLIGVRTHPWGAHSWVQFEELVLDERPDDVNEYVPLLTA